MIRTFDWKPKHDPRSRDFGIRTLVGAVPTSAVWWAPGRAVLDQGREGACAGFAAAGEAAASPVRVGGIDNLYAQRWYERARQLDEFPGESYSGTSINGTMKVGRERGMWSSYHWAFGTDDVKRALVLGPVVIGIPWFEGMYNTAISGRVVVSGELVGGHALLVTGWTPNWRGCGPAFRWRNSWGPDYGVNGNGYVLEGDFTHLIRQDGEAAIPTGRSLGGIRAKMLSGIANALDSLRERL